MKPPRVFAVLEGRSAEEGAEGGPAGRRWGGRRPVAAARRSPDRPEDSAPEAITTKRHDASSGLVLPSMFIYLIDEFTRWASNRIGSNRLPKKFATCLKRRFRSDRYTVVKWSALRVPSRFQTRDHFGGCQGKTRGFHWTHRRISADGLLPGYRRRRLYRIPPGPVARRARRVGAGGRQLHHRQAPKPRGGLR